MDIRTVVAELINSVGPTVVQTMAGTMDRAAVHEWARSDGPVPISEEVARLCLGHRDWKYLVLEEGKDVALAWLMGANPRLGGEMPVLAIQQLRTSEVLGAAEVFVADAQAP